MVASVGRRMDIIYAACEEKADLWASLDHLRLLPLQVVNVRCHGASDCRLHAPPARPRRVVVCALAKVHPRRDWVT